jgi:MerR family transcriptional regulator, light-induced transcriptional regulator
MAAIEGWMGGRDRSSLEAGRMESAADGIEGRRRLARLVRTIEGEIVPRLVIATRMQDNDASQQLRRNCMPDEIDVKEMVRLLLGHEPDVASAYVETVRRRGASLEMICLDLLAPAARELGTLWEEDECDFMQVTVGLCRLHQVLRALSPAFESQGSNQEGERRILLASYPGEQHTFGITLVAQFLRRDGWDVWQEFPENPADLLAMTGEISFAAVGLSVGCAARLSSVTETIRAIRKTSRNRAVGILIGGSAFVGKPELAVRMGADATASDGREAVREAKKIRADGWRRGLGLQSAG